MFSRRRQGQVKDSKRSSWKIPNVWKVSSIAEGMCVGEGPSAARADLVLLPNGKQHESALVVTWTRLRKTVQQLKTKTVSTVHGLISTWRRNGRCESEESLVWKSARIESQVKEKLKTAMCSKIPARMYRALSCDLTCIFCVATWVVFPRIARTATRMTMQRYLARLIFRKFEHSFCSSPLCMIIYACWFEFRYSDWFKIATCRPRWDYKGSYRIKDSTSVGLPWTTSWEDGIRYVEGCANLLDISAIWISLKSLILFVPPCFFEGMTVLRSSNTYESMEFWFLQ